MNYQCEVCHVFEEVLEELGETFCDFCPPDVLEIVCEAIEQLEGTFDPLLDGYYARQYCKEVYCNVRDFRDTAVTYLYCAKKVLIQGERLSEKEFADTDDYIKEAICWTEKAKLCLCYVVISESCDDCDTSSCDDSCDTSSCDDSCDTSSSCADSCDTSPSCADSCDTSSYFSSC